MTSSSSPFDEAIAINLGDETCSVGLWRDSGQENDRLLSKLPQGHTFHSFPAIVAFTNRGILIGQEAFDQMLNNPTNTAFGLSQILGRRYDSVQLQHGANYWPFKIVQKDDRVCIELPINGSQRLVTPEEIVAVLFAKLRQEMETYLGLRITKTVLVVPAQADEAYRCSIRVAAKLAGLQLLRIVTNATAVAASLALAHHGAARRTAVLILEIGSSYFSATKVAIEGGTIQTILISSNADLNSSIDAFLLTHFAHTIKEMSNKSPFDSRVLVQLHVACMQAKTALMSAKQVVLHFDINVGGTPLEVVLTRAKFEEIVAPFLQRLRSNLQFSWNVAQIVLSSPAYSIPCVMHVLRQAFPSCTLTWPISSPAPRLCREAATFGATLFAAVIQGVKATEFDEVTIVDATLFSYGVCLEETEEVSLLFQPLARLPCRSIVKASTVVHHQRKLSIRVFARENERPYALIATVVVSSIAPMPLGQAQIDVVLEIDGNGILLCSAHYAGGRGTSLPVQTVRPSCLSDEEIEWIERERVLISLYERSCARN